MLSYGRGSINKGFMCVSRSHTWLKWWFAFACKLVYKSNIQDEYCNVLLPKTQAASNLTLAHTLPRCLLEMNSSTTWLEGRWMSSAVKNLDSDPVRTSNITQPSHENKKWECEQFVHIFQSIPCNIKIARIPLSNMHLKYVHLGGCSCQTPFDIVEVYIITTVTRKYFCVHERTC